MNSKTLELVFATAGGGRLRLSVPRLVLRYTTARVSKTCWRYQHLWHWLILEKSHVKKQLSLRSYGRNIMPVSLKLYLLKTQIHTGPTAAIMCKGGA